MEILLQVLRLLATIAVAFCVGKLVAKLHLPAILGWLITGMALGPHALGLMNDAVMDSAWFTTTESLLESVVGLMIGTELIWSQMKRSGKQIVVTTITESLGTFLIVTLVFGVIFYFTGHAAVSRGDVRRHSARHGPCSVPVHSQRGQGGRTGDQHADTHGGA